MARVTAGVTTSHVPAIGAAWDRGQSGSDYWRPVFAGYDWSKRWIADQAPDVVVLVYNDHASAFSLELIPTFAIGCAERFMPADEGFGPRPVPVVEGHPDLAWHIAQSTILDEFDMTIVNKMDVDHGLTIPLSLMFGQPEAWPVKVIPLSVNVIQYPPPTGNRCYLLGEAIRRAIESYPEDLQVQVWGTGGMSHQLQGAACGTDQSRVRRGIPGQDHGRSRGAAPHAAHRISARGRLGGDRARDVADHAGCPREDPKELHRFYHVPASNTALGHLVLEADR